MTDSSTLLTVIIPCFNEGRNVEKLFVEALAITKIEPKINFIIVDNGSTDNSFQTIKDVGFEPEVRVLSLANNQGYGGGIIYGLCETKSDYVGWTHADGQTPLMDIIKCVKLIEENDRTIFIKGYRTGRRPSDQFFSIAMGVFASILFQVKLSEINAQPTVFEADLIPDIQRGPTDFSIDLATFLLAQQKNKKIFRFYTTFAKREHGKSSWNTSTLSRIRFIVRTVRYCLRERIRTRG